MPRVLNKRTDEVPADAVYVGRPTQFGNPFIMQGESGRELVIENYRKWLATPEGKVIAARARQELRGKDLVCWCSPKPCHADVLLEIANVPRDTPSREQK